MHDDVPQKAVRSPHSLAGCSMNTIAREGQRADDSQVWGAGGRGEERGLSSTRIQRRVGSASIAILIGPCLFLPGGPVEADGGKCASWHSAAVSHPQSPSLRLPHPHRVCPRGGALPLLTPPLLLLPFYLLFLLLFLFLPRVLLLLFLLLFLPLLPATQTWFVRLIPQILSDTHAHTHSPARPACLCFPRVVSSPVNSTYEDFSHSSAAPLSVACHSRLHTAGYI